MKSLISLASRVRVFATIAIVFALGGITIGAVQIANAAGRNITYHACLSRGVLSKVGTSTPSCAAGFKVISWNSTGPQGPQGLKGGIGPKGPQGLKGSIGLKGPQGNVGPAGPQGNVGSTGPQGQSGVASVQYISASATVPTGQILTKTVYCPSGTMATGGGVQSGDISSGLVYIESSYPYIVSGNALAWIVQLANASPDAVSPVFWAVCI